MNDLDDDDASVEDCAENDDDVCLVDRICKSCGRVNKKAVFTYSQVAYGGSVVNFFYSSSASGMNIWKPGLTDIYRQRDRKWIRETETNI